MKDKIWVSDSILDSTIIKKVTIYPVHNDPDHDSAVSFWGKSQEKYDKGISLSESEIPKAAYGDYATTRIKKLPDFFNLNRFFVVSSAFAEVLDKFDLGTGGPHPIALYQGNRTELIEGDWFLLNFGCHKQAFLPEESSGGYENLDIRSAYKWTVKRPKKWMVSMPKNFEIAVSSDALNGCDLWKDPGLHAAFFISGALEAALTEKKLTRTLKRYRCKII